MCTSYTHDRLVDQLECYMDDLVDCFEEFVKKSMLIISVAVGTLVLMVMYVLKLMSERAVSRGITSNTTVDTECFDKCCQCNKQDLTECTTNVQNLRTNTESLMDAYLPSANGIRTVSLQVIPNTYPSSDNNFTKEIEMYIISKPCDTCKQTQVSEDLKSARIEYKLTTTTRQSCISKRVGSEFMPEHKTLHNTSYLNISGEMINISISFVELSSKLRLVLGITCKETVLMPYNPLSTSRHCSKVIAKRNSCCSMCCGDERCNK